MTRVGIVAQSQLLGRVDAPMATQNHTRLVHQHRGREAKGLDAGLQLDELLVGVRAWVAGPGLQITGRALDDLTNV